MLSGSHRVLLQHAHAAQHRRRHPRPAPAHAVGRFRSTSKVCGGRSAVAAGPQARTRECEARPRAASAAARARPSRRPARTVPGSPRTGNRRRSQRQSARTRARGRRWRWRPRRCPLRVACGKPLLQHRRDLFAIDHGTCTVALQRLCRAAECSRSSASSAARFRTSGGRRGVLCRTSGNRLPRFRRYDADHSHRERSALACVLPRVGACSRPRATSPASSGAAAALSAARRAVHCGDACGPVRRRRPTPDAFCCHGCEAVHAALAAHGLGGYYQCEVTPGISQRGRGSRR